LCYRLIAAVGDDKAINQWEVTATHVHSLLTVQINSLLRCV